MTAARPNRSHPTTPDGRYFVVRGRLWRTSNPSLDAEERAAWVSELMSARRAVRLALENPDSGEALQEARARVDVAKRHLGERGPVWWTDGAPDLNQHMVRNTAYAGWFEALETADQEG